MSRMIYSKQKKIYDWSYGNPKQHLLGYGQHVDLVSEDCKNHKNWGLLTYVIIF